MFELGNNLREARQGRRIDLVIAEQDTKIRSKYLSALETEDFDVLPGPVFVRGFLRTYSRYLGLDPQLFIDEYNARFGRFEEVEEHTSPALGRPGLAQQRVNRGRRTMRVFLAASLIALAGLAWLGLRESEEPPVDRIEPRPTSGAPESAVIPPRQAGNLGDAAEEARTSTPVGAEAPAATQAPARRRSDKATATPRP